MINKIDAAKRQIECAIRLVAAEEDELAIHTVVMAAYGVLEHLAKGSEYFETGMKPHLTQIGRDRLRSTANFLKHADRDPDGAISPPPPGDLEWRIGFCILLYRHLDGAFTPTMAAFHCWMVLLRPDEFQIEEDADAEFEMTYRQLLIVLKDPQPRFFLLNALLKTYQDGLVSPSRGFRRRSPDGDPAH